MEKNLTTDIYNKLRKIRRARGLTVNKLAEKMGENHQKVGRIERGKSNLTIDYLLKLSKALDTPIDSFIQEDGHSAPQEEGHLLLNEIVLFVEQHSQSLGIKGDPEKKAKLISTLYTEAMKIPRSQQKTFLSSLLNSLVVLKTTL